MVANQTNFWSRCRGISLALLLSAAAILMVAPAHHAAFAQTNISGGIAGNVTDSTGAAVPNATVVVTSLATGEVKTVTSGGSGEYRVPLLTPGQYRVEIQAATFEKSRFVVTVSPGTNTPGDVKLQIGQSSTTVNVSEEEPLLHTTEAQISTTFSLEQIQTLPNPGNDLTFIAQTAPGSTMNTQAGYGNFSSFGLPATSNTFTVNGGYENDPFLNISNSGATNLLLGNNDVATVTVVSPAYNATFGGLAGAQVAEISRSGSNGFHGNLAYWWNGSVMNGNDWFNNNTGTKRPRSNANQWAAAIGGPIKKDKAFFFVNTEGIRVVIPVRGTVYAPSAKWQSIITGPSYNDGASKACQAYYGANPTSSSEAGCYAPVGNLAANGYSAQVPIYKTLFNYFNTAPGASAATAVAADDRFVQFNGQSSNFAREWLLTGRFDLNVTDKDRLFVHYKQDKGVQPTYTSLINPIFNAESPQPQYEGQTGWTRSISPSITNQFLVTGLYYRAIFTNTSQAAATASLPLVFIPLDGSWLNNDTSINPPQFVGGEDFAFPQGRNVTGYQFQDDLSISHGNHTISLGASFRRDDVTDYTPSEHVVGEALTFDNGNFAGGFTDRWQQRFPTRLTQPLAIYTLGIYAQDQWKIQPNFTLTAGLRVEHNSNPVCHTNCFANLAGDFNSLPGAATTPYNKLISSGRNQAFLSQQPFGIDPRVGFAWLPSGAGSKTTVRGGFGLFTDTFPAQIASSLDTNAPNVAAFTILGKAYGNPTSLDPSLPDSGSAIAAQSNAAFRSAYDSGGSYATIKAATGGTFSAPAFTATAPKVHMPTTEEYSLSLERQLDSKTVVSLSYVGNHGYHGPVLNPGLNSFSKSGAVAGAPAAAPNQSFGTVQVYSSINQSNYNGLLATLSRRSKDVTVQFNYTYSHAMDLVSNGGFDGFSANAVGLENPYNSSFNYGNADYNVKHYVSADYVIEIPVWKGPKVLVGGWELAGTVFHSSGLPFSVTDSGTVVANYAGTLFAQPLNNNVPHSCGGASHAGVSATPCGFGAFSGSSLVNFASATAFGQGSRNAFTGPGYTDTDLSLTKAFHIPVSDAMQVKLGAQIYNLLNHPNFAQPNSDVGTGPGSFGVIQSTVSTPTSILGSFLGGDASPRLIQLTGKITF